MPSVPRLFAQAARQARPAARFTAPALQQRRGNATAVDPPRQKQWTREEIQEIYDTPLMDLIFQAVRSRHLRAPRCTGADGHDTPPKLIRCPRPRVSPTGYRAPIEPAP